jgi:hypothetical protein
MHCVVTALHYEDGTNAGMPIGHAVKTKQAEMEPRIRSELDII